jgi:hypothetical protein
MSAGGPGRPDDSAYIGCVGMILLYALACVAIGFLHSLGLIL